MREVFIVAGMLVLTVAGLWRLPSFWRGDTALRHRDDHVPAPSGWLRGMPAAIVGLPFVTVSMATAMFLSSGFGESEPAVAVAVFVGSLLIALAAFVLMVTTSLFGFPKAAVPPWLRPTRAPDVADLGDGTGRGHR